LDLAVELYVAVSQVKQGAGEDVAGAKTETDGPGAAGAAEEVNAFA
jgi:hypothetical protein